MKKTIPIYGDIILVVLCILSFCFVTPRSFKKAQADINEAYGVGAISKIEKTAMEHRFKCVRNGIDGTTIIIMMIFVLYNLFFSGTKKSQDNDNPDNDNNGPNLTIVKKTGDPVLPSRLNISIDSNHPKEAA